MESVVGFFVLVISLTFFGLGYLVVVDREDKIESQKTFILGNATYKCTKTNELIDSEEI